MLSTPRTRTKPAHKAQKPPLAVDLTVTFRFGDEPKDKVTVINNRRVPMVGSVFDSRDTVIRGFVRLLFKAAVMQPKVVSELLPAIRMLRRRRRR
ncbi:MAG: hypothetical protein ACT4P0_02090 [Panacagrimonas sp.]